MDYRERIRRLVKQRHHDGTICACRANVYVRMRHVRNVANDQAEQQSVVVNQPQLRMAKRGLANGWDLLTPCQSQVEHSNCAMVRVSMFPGVIMGVAVIAC